MSARDLLKHHAEPTAADLAAHAMVSEDMETEHAPAASLELAAAADAGGVAVPDKRYFRIGEVADIVRVEAHVLRYWEREFRSVRPAKSARGQRVYSRADVLKLVRIRDLLYRDKFTIAGARKQLSLQSKQPAVLPVGEPSVALEESASDAARPQAAAEPPRTAHVQPADVAAAHAAEASRQAQSAAVRADDARLLFARLDAIRQELDTFLSELTPSTGT